MIDFVLDFIGSGFGMIGDFFFTLFGFLAKPLSYLLDFLTAIFYAIYQLFLIVVRVIMIFVALLQFFGSLVVGFFRSLYSLLTIDFYKNTPRYPNETAQGIGIVVDLLRPTGVITVVPLIILAIVWAIFVRKIIGLFGGEVRADA